MKYLFIIMLLSISTGAFSDPATISKVEFVYVLDSERSFDFAGDSAHECGSNLYRTRSLTEEIINRKFSLVLTAYAAQKRLIVNTEGCDGNRMKFGWVRLIDGV